MKSVFKNVFKSILEGNFLLRLHIGDYFVHIAYCFVLIGIAIWISLGIDMTMNREEKNRQTIAELDNRIAILTYETAKMTRRSEVEYRLENMGSKVGEVTKPATRIGHGSKQNGTR